MLRREEAADAKSVAQHKAAPAFHTQLQTLRLEIDPLWQCMCPAGYH